MTVVETVNKKFKDSSLIYHYEEYFPSSLSIHVTALPTKEPENRDCVFVEGVIEIVFNNKDKLFALECIKKDLSYLDYHSDYTNADFGDHLRKVPPLEEYIYDDLVIFYKTLLRLGSKNSFGGSHLNTYVTSVPVV